MERSLRGQRTLSKQAEIEELEDETVPQISIPSSSPTVDSVTTPSLQQSCHCCQGDDSHPQCKHKVVKEEAQPKEMEKTPPPPQRVRSHAKVKLLVRSHAMREETSPPPDPEAEHLVLPPVTVQPQPQSQPQQQQQQQQQPLQQQVPQQQQQPQPPHQQQVAQQQQPPHQQQVPQQQQPPHQQQVPQQQQPPHQQQVPQQQPHQQQQVCSNNSLSVIRPNSRHKLRHQGSSQGSMDSSSPCLSRDSSTEQYTDSTGVDLQQFIMETLNRNHKDRLLLLKIEHELVNLAKDNKRNHYKFPQMSSYQRMLVHRVAAYFGMDHNVDQTGSAVIVNRTKNTRLPDTKFRDHIRDEVCFPEEPRRSILKRDSSSFDESCNFKSPERQFSTESRRSKSFEEREEEYEKARKRIFNREDGMEQLQDSSRRSSQEELRWPGEVQPWSSSDSDTSGRLRSNMLLHVSDSNSQYRSARLLKVESFEGRDTLKANSLRLSVSKSYSFGGYPVSVLSRGDSCTSTHSAGARLLTKQDSGSSMSSRLSPSSSGYKSQSQRSDTTMSATPSPTATPISQLSISSSTQPQTSSHGAPSPQNTPESNGEEQVVQPSQTVMWAVTSMASVPPGSVLINPQTGQPYVNSDGTVYRYDPANPPKVVTEEESDSTVTSSMVTPVSTNSHHHQNPSSDQSQHQKQSSCQSQKSHLPTSSSCTATTSSKTTSSSAHVTTTATSPSLPTSPPPAPSSTSAATTASHSSVLAAHQPVLTICHSSQCTYLPQPAGGGSEAAQHAMPLAPLPLCSQTHSYHQQTSQQFVPAPLQHQQSTEMMFPSASQCHAAQPAAAAPPSSQMVFAGYNMMPIPPNAANGTGSTPMVATTAAYDQRPSEAGSMSMSELSSYFMGLSMVSTEQRGGGDNTNSQQPQQQPVPPIHPHTYQPQAPAAAATAYWQPQQSSPLQCWACVPQQQQPPAPPPPPPPPPSATQQTPQQQGPPPPIPPQQQQQQAAPPQPMYYVPPPPHLNTSPPQQQVCATTNSSTAPRYVAAASVYPSYQQTPNGTPTMCAPALPPQVQQQNHQDRSQQNMGHNGGYVSGYPVVTYGGAVPGPVMAAAGSGECMPLYTQPSLHMLYTPTSINMSSLSSSTASVTSSAMPGGATVPYYHPATPPAAHSQPVMGLNMGPAYMQPSQPGAPAIGSYRAPTPPQTPTQNQALCSVASHPYVYLNGGGYAPVYNGSGPNSNNTTPGPYSQQSGGNPPTPGPTQYIPPAIISNLGLFRTNMQMMSNVRSSPPPRPPREGSGSKPPYSRSPSVGSKDRSNGHHYDGCSEKSLTGMRYPSMPMFGLRIMPGDMRVMGPPLQQSLSAASPALRMPFTLPPHPTPTPTPSSHRMPHHQQAPHYPLGSQSSGSEVSIGSVGRPPKPRKQRSKMVTPVPSNRSALPSQVSGQPNSQQAVTLPVTIDGVTTEQGRVLLNEESPSKQH